MSCLCRNGECCFSSGNVFVLPGSMKISSFLKPYYAEEMVAYPVPNIINKIGFNANNPEVLKQFDYVDLPNL